MPSKLREECKDGFGGTEAYKLLLRCIDELTVTEGDTIRVRAKEDGGFHSKMLQSPPDPDITFRVKAGKERRVHAANVEEAVGENGGLLQVGNTLVWKRIDNATLLEGLMKSCGAYRVPQ